jgi:hypothetical protein
MIANSGETFDDTSDPRQGPQIRAKAVVAGPLSEGLIDQLPLL